MAAIGEGDAITAGLRPVMRPLAETRWRLVGVTSAAL